jgi:D-alanyl-lipoteichoic acid acyltransferase DltB (MBOAT superfamily)
MLFPTIEFAAFFLVVLVLSWRLMPRPTLWKPFMLAVSYVFYGFTDARFVLLILGSTVFNQISAEVIHRLGPRGSGIAVKVAVAGNLALLGWFKYYGFFVDSVSELFARFGAQPPLPLLQVVLPVGISFFTFQAISYVVDVHRGAVTPATPIDFAVYLSFFPHLVAGPIVRASEFIPQLSRPRDRRDIDASRAVFLIVGGMIKKLVIADVLATKIVDGVFSQPGQHSALEVLIGIYGYAVQIFCDFSGYTDMAIGIALLLGFRFPQNFDAPYRAATLQDFWRRWHMSLSRWLRDYLYIPLGGNRKGARRTQINLMLTMLLGGLWHGAAWTFVVWGGIHGAGLAVERKVLDRTGEPVTFAARWAGRLITFHVVCLAWVFFRAESLGSAFEVLGRLTSAGPAPLVTTAVLVAIAVGLAVQYVPADATLRLQAAFSRLTVPAQGLALGVTLMLVDAFANPGVAPFLYFQF